MHIYAHKHAHTDDRYIHIIPLSQLLPISTSTDRHRNPASQITLDNLNMDKGKKKHILKRVFCVIFQILKNKE